MEKQQLDDYLLSKQLRIEAFKELSGSYLLTEEMMLAFQNELDWTKVSANNSMHHLQIGLLQFEQRLQMSCLHQHL